MKLFQYSKKTAGVKTKIKETNLPEKNKEHFSSKRFDDSKYNGLGLRLLRLCFNILLHIQICLILEI